MRVQRYRLSFAKARVFFKIIPYGERGSLQNVLLSLPKHLAWGSNSIVRRRERDASASSAGRSEVSQSFNDAGEMLRCALHDVIPSFNEASEMLRLRGHLMSRTFWSEPMFWCKPMGYNKPMCWLLRLKQKKARQRRASLLQS
jgi:hypothetical protein